MLCPILGQKLHPLLRSSPQTRCLSVQDALLPEYRTHCSCTETLCTAEESFSYFLGREQSRVGLLCSHISLGLVQAHAKFPGHPYYLCIDLYFRAKPMACMWALGHPCAHRWFEPDGAGNSRPQLVAYNRKYRCTRDTKWRLTELLRGLTSTEAFGTWRLNTCTDLSNLPTVAQGVSSRAGNCTQAACIPVIRILFLSTFKAKAHNSLL